MLKVKDLAVGIPDKLKLNYVEGSGNILHNTDANKHAVGVNYALDVVSNLEVSPDKLLDAVEFDREALAKVIQEGMGFKFVPKDVLEKELGIMQADFLNWSFCTMLSDALISNKVKILGVKK